MCLTIKLCSLSRSSYEDALYQSRASIFCLALPILTGSSSTMDSQTFPKLYIFYPEDTWYRTCDLLHSKHAFSVCYGLFPNIAVTKIWKTMERYIHLIYHKWFHVLPVSACFIVPECHSKCTLSKNLSWLFNGKYMYISTCQNTLFKKAHQPLATED